MTPDLCIRVVLYVWVGTWLCGASPLPARPQRETRVALVNDVNVLMYGVLQFSESLRNMYQNTEDKLSRIAQAIKHTEGLVQRLGQDTEQAVHSEKQIKERLSLIQDQMELLQIQAQKTKGLVNEVEQDDVELRQKLTGLETSLNIFTHDRIRAMKETALKHNKILEDLIIWTEKQKQQLKTQNMQLARLQI